MNRKIETIFDELFTRYPNLQELKVDFMNVFHLLCRCYEGKGKLLVCGNGGSASDSEHITAELMKGFLLKRSLNEVDMAKFNDGDEKIFALNLQYGLPTISLVSQTALITAIDNDNGADMVFAQQVFNYGNRNDTLIGISTSGNSKNVINAVKVAKSIGMKTVVFTGNNGGILKNIVDEAICVPESSVYKIQDYHVPIYHTLCAMLEEEFFGKIENDLQKS